jgi:transposase
MSMSLSDKQMSLIPSDQWPEDVTAELETGRNPTFTAARFRARRPRDYALVVSMLSEGLSMRQVSRALRCSINTVSTVWDRERGGADVETHKTNTVKRLRRLQVLTAERLQEVIEDGDISGRDLVVALGVITDKIELLEGRATARVDSSDGPMSRERLAETLCEIRKAATATGFRGGYRDEKAAVGVVVVPARGAGGSGLAGVSADRLSGAQALRRSDLQRGAGGFDVDGGAVVDNFDDCADGAGGGATENASPSDKDGSGEENFIGKGGVDE